jgi:hypothetical protein
MEDSVDKQVADFDWEIDEDTQDHLRSLGLWKDEFDPTNGRNYISENFKRNEKED